MSGTQSLLMKGKTETFNEDNSEAFSPAEKQKLNTLQDIYNNKHIRCSSLSMIVGR